MTNNYCIIIYMPPFISYNEVHSLTLDIHLLFQLHTHVHIHRFHSLIATVMLCASFLIFVLGCFSSQGTCYFLISTQVCENLSDCCFHYILPIIMLSSRNKFISKPLGENDKKQSVLFPCPFIRLEMSRKI